MGTVTTAGVNASVPFIPAAGQAYLGSKVEPAPQIATQRFTAAAGIAAGGNTPVVTITPGSGTNAVLLTQAGYDWAGNFTYKAGTASIFGGTIATVTFGSPLDVAPVSVIVNAASNSGTIGLQVGAINLAATGFGISGNAPASGGTYTVNWQVVRSPL